MTDTLPSVASSRMTEEIGRVLGNRYRIIRPIGQGASAQVFLADDTRLRRRVAVKMLHPALADDAEFLRRFQAEAHAVAQLNHPNIMAVYDWGQESEIPYLVTEFLAGGSLRGMLDQGTRLSLSQLLKVGLEASRALEYAESRGLVHRDIKPANLLFGDDSRLRIADFGLARALAEAAWTEPQGAVLGTARYSSPEQAQGAWLTAKADVYSLALVMVEAATGEVPFTADTTIGTLMARIGKPLPVPEALGALAPILERAGNPDVDLRLDAHRLGVALMAAADKLGPAEPLPLAGATTVDPLLDVDADPTMHTGSRLHSAGTMPSIVVGPGGDDGDESSEVLDLTDATVAPDLPTTGEPLAPDESEDGADDADATVTVAEEGPIRPSRRDRRHARRQERADEKSEIAPAGFTPGPDDEPKRRRRWPWLALVALIVLSTVAAAVAVTRLDDDPGTVTSAATPTHVVPALMGQSEDDARAIVAEFKWEVETTLTRRDDTVAGEVVAVDPAPGEELAEGETLKLTVSEGTEARTLPDLAGKTYEEAEAVLSVLKLVPKPTEAYSETVAEGLVIGAAEGTPAELYQNDPVEVIVSLGPEPRTVPTGLAGMSLEQAREQLAAVGLVAEVEREFDDNVGVGLVIKVPAEGTKVPRDSAVQVLVSKGPDLVVVPDVSQAGSLIEAVAMLQNAGTGIGGVSGFALGLPVRTDPPAGSKVKRGSAVNIILG